MRPSVLLVEDQKLLRVSLKVSLESLGCCTVCGEADNGEDAVKEASRLRPDVILMDVGLPKLDGIEATWRIKQEQPRTRIIILTSHNDPKSISAALGAGANAYCTKDTPMENVSLAMEAVLRGETWLDPSIANLVVQDHDAKNELDIELSSKELSILRLMKQEFTNQDIASRLGTSPDSIARALNNLLTKFVDKKAKLEDETNREHSQLNEWLTALHPDVGSETIFEEKYLIGDAIGVGGLGSVYKAKHLYIDRPVAIKMLHSEMAADKLAMRSFQREATAIAGLQHKNIVSLYDFGLSKTGQPYLVMEFVNGRDLATILQEEKVVLLDRAIKLFLQISEGLSAAHSKGIIHCDLKPSNVLVTGDEPDELLKLVDFGLVQLIPTAANNNLEITQKQFICGTPSYMAPEQCMGKPTDPRTDIYALGCLMYETLVGEVPFHGNTAMEIFAKQIESSAPSLASLCFARGLPQGIGILVDSMLSKNPEHRPQTMLEVMSTLKHVI